MMEILRSRGGEDPTAAAHDTNSTSSPTAGAGGPGFGLHGSALDRSGLGRSLANLSLNSIDARQSARAARGLADKGGPSKGEDQPPAATSAAAAAAGVGSARAVLIEKCRYAPTAWDDQLLPEDIALSLSQVAVLWAALLPHVKPAVVSVVLRAEGQLAPSALCGRLLQVASQPPLALSVLSSIACKSSPVGTGAAAAAAAAAAATRGGGSVAVTVVNRTRSVEELLRTQAEMCALGVVSAFLAMRSVSEPWPVGHTWATGATQRLPRSTQGIAAIEPQTAADHVLVCGIFDSVIAALNRERPQPTKQQSIIGTAGNISSGSSRPLRNALGKVTGHGADNSITGGSSGAIKRSASASVALSEGGSSSDPGGGAGVGSASADAARLHVHLVYTLFWRVMTACCSSRCSESAFLSAMDGALSQVSKIPTHSPAPTAAAAAAVHHHPLRANSSDEVVGADLMRRRLEGGGPLGSRAVAVPVVASGHLLQLGPSILKAGGGGGGGGGSVGLSAALAQAGLADSPAAAAFSCSEVAWLHSLLALAADSWARNSAAQRTTLLLLKWILAR